MLRKTPLYQQHCQANATMINFSGWEMPLHYGSQIKEHEQVRKQAGMFDVSHMVIIDISGPDAKPYLRNLLANNVDRLTQTFKALYSCMLTQKGGVVDDLIVYALAQNKFRLIMNAATHDKDFAWLQIHSHQREIQIQERTDLGLLAIQGPQAIPLTIQVLSKNHADHLNKLEPFCGIKLDDWLIARTGYTGEDGLEIMLPHKAMPTLWEKLLAIGITPCGLGARDTLRLEAGLMLYGQDLDEQHTPLESGLSWTIAWEPVARNFIGRTALVKQQQGGIQNKLVGLVMKAKGVMRPKQKVFFSQNESGMITSGSFSPTLGCSIALARVPNDAKGDCFVQIRGKQQPVTLVKPRFVKNGKPIHLGAINDD